MTDTILYDFGAVIMDWNPHYLYDEYFQDKDKSEWFLSNICTGTWNSQMDAGKPLVQGTEELVAKYPEWEKEIRMYYGEWTRMIPGCIPGMVDFVTDFKKRGFKAYGLSNWSAETFSWVKNKFPVFSLLDGIQLSGEIKINKPDSRFFELAIDQFGLIPENCVFIDDNPANLEAAARFGIRGIQFRNADQARAEMESILK